MKAQQARSHHPFSSIGYTFPTAHCRVLWIACIATVLSTCVDVACATHEAIKVGVMLESTDKVLHETLRIARDKVNLDGSFLRLDLLTMNFTPGDSHKAAKTVCAMLKQEVDLVIGPPSFFTSSHVQSICKWLHVPHIEVTEDFRKKKTGSSVNLLPHPRTLSNAYAALIGQWEWYDEFAVIYEVPEDLFRIQDMLHFPTKRAFIFQLKTMTDDRLLLKEIKNKALMRIVLALRLELLLHYFEMAQEVGLTSEYYDYVIPNLDVATINFEKYYGNRMNITGFQLVDPTLNSYKDFLRHLHQKVFNSTLEDPDAQQQIIKTQVALLYDAVLLYYHVISNLYRNSTRKKFSNANCDDISLDHQQNDDIIDKLKLSSFHGLTGFIKFDDNGVRKDFTVNIIRLMYVDEPGFIKIATWNERRGFVPIFIQENSDTSLWDNTLKVTSILNPPFLMEIPEENRVPGGPKYQGYVVDLMKEVATDFIINVVKDGKYGAYNAKERTWDGMIGELLRKEADLCAADLTITPQRQSAVDFTMPFMNLGIGILFKKSAKVGTSMFSFLEPLSAEVWISMIAGYLGVSIVMFMIARLSPYEWHRPHPCNLKSNELTNSFNLINSLWCNIAALMQQGSDLVPKAISTRMITGIWWFFTLIMISSCTANLAAFLTAASMDSPITGAEDLSRQNKIKYGTVIEGSTQNFFKNSNSEVYKKMWHFMASAKPGVFVNNNDEGVAKVKRGDYALFMETSLIEYVIATECELTQIGAPLDTKGYGVALRKNSPHRSRVNRAILRLQDQGILQNLKQRWWQEKGLNQKCPEEESDSMELGIANVGGIFVLLLVGCAAAVIIGAIEFIWNVRKNVIDKDMFWKELKKQMTFACSFGKSTKPITKENVVELPAFISEAVQKSRASTDTRPSPFRTRCRSLP